MKKSRRPAFVSPLFYAWSHFALAVFLGLLMTPLYPFLAQDRVNVAQLADTTIQENYETLISYNLNPFHQTLQFQQLSQSPSALKHFVEVKVVFQLLLWSGLVCLLFLVFHTLRAREPESLSFFPTGFRLSLILPALLFFPLLLFFDQAFVLFHQLLFRNKDWIFDPQRDPIICYLPEAFFRNIAFLMLLLWLALLLLSRFLLYPRLLSRLKRKDSTQAEGDKKGHGE